LIKLDRRAKVVKRTRYYDRWSWRSYNQGLQSRV